MGQGRASGASKPVRKRALRKGTRQSGMSMSSTSSSRRAAQVEISDVSVSEAAAETLGGPDAIGFQVVSDADMAKAVKCRFPVKVIDALKKAGVTDKEIGDLIIKPRTLSHRREARQRLTVEESDRAARLARVLALAEKTFANKDKANRWLHKNLRSLDGQQPIELVQTTAGTRIVEDILTRIAWGAAA